MFKNQKFFPVTISIFSGILIALVIRLNAALGEHIGVFESSFFVHAIGALFAIPFLFRKGHIFSPISLRTIPPYLLLGGLYGMVIVVMSNFLVTRLGMALTIGSFLAANLLCGAIADHYGVFGLLKFRCNRQRLLGLLSAVLGVVLLIG